MAHLRSAKSEPTSPDASTEAPAFDVVEPNAERAARRRQRMMDLVLVFVTASVFALAFLPVWTARRVDRIDQGIEQTLERARELNTRFFRHQMQAMGLTQALAETAEPLARQRYLDSYRAHRDTVGVVHRELTEISKSIDRQLELEVLTLANRSDEWHMSFNPVLRGEVSAADFQRNVTSEQMDYQAILEQVGIVEEQLSQRIAAARTRAEAAVSQQWSIGLFLVFLAVFSVLAVSYVARRTHFLTRESEIRRRAAVDARREADAVLAGTGDGVIGVDLDGRCTFVNRAATEMLGRSGPSLLGKSIHAQVHGVREDGSPYPPDECPLMAALQLDRATPPIDEHFVRGDGSVFPVQVFSRPLVDGVDVRGAVLSFVDMTEIREAERKLRSAIRVREEIVGIVSHDLRNPAGTVALAADLLLEVPLPPEKQREQLQVIKRQAKHMERMIRDLLDVTRIESGTLPIHPGPEPLASLVNEALQDFNGLAGQKHITLGQEIDPGLPLVRADRNRILQVFSNLVGNAIKFTPEGGRVTLCASRENGEVVVSVVDTGKGIAPEDTGRIFGRFWQVGRKTDGTGVGLGLAIVKGIVEAHDGRVWVESEPGLGSSFRFTLPALGPGEAEMGSPIEA